MIHNAITGINVKTIHENIFFKGKLKYDLINKLMAFIFQLFKT